MFIKQLEVGGELFLEKDDEEKGKEKESKARNCSKSRLKDGQVVLLVALGVLHHGLQLRVGLPPPLLQHVEDLPEGRVPGGLSR